MPADGNRELHANTGEAEQAARNCGRRGRQYLRRRLYSDNKVYKVSVAYSLLSRRRHGHGRHSGRQQWRRRAGYFCKPFDGPRGVWADSLGNVYIADTTANKIREVNPTAGTIQTIAGTGTASSTGDNGPALSATINNPQGVLVDSNLNVYIADSSGGKIRVICVTCGTNSPLDALLSKLGISSPVNGNMYTIAGGASQSYTGAFPTLGTHVTMSPQKLAADVNGNLYISDGNGAAWFLDAYTANVRPIAGKTTTNCSSETDSYGDGCPATQAVIGDAGNGIGVGTDALGNIYISDTQNLRIRKITNDLVSSATSVGATTTQPIELHFAPGDSLASASGLVVNSSEWILSTPTCTTNSDNTADCLLTSSFTPSVPGGRSAPLAVNSANNNIAYLPLTGQGMGAGATLDPATQSAFGSNLAVAGLASDNAGNVYVSDATSKQVLQFTATSIAQGAAVGTPLASFQARKCRRRCSRVCVRGRHVGWHSDADLTCGKRGHRSCSPSPGQLDWP